MLEVLQPGRTFRQFGEWTVEFTSFFPRPLGWFWNLPLASLASSEVAGFSRLAGRGFATDICKS
jgi:hypothetical protein